MKISINANRCEPSPMRKFHPLAVNAQKQGKKIYHLNIGQPDLATPQAYYDAIRDFDHTTLEYEASPGMPRMIDAVKNYYKQYGLNSLPNESAYTDWSANLPDQLGSSAFRNWLNKVNINLSESTLDSVDKMVSQYWPVLTDAQRESVQQLFSNYGQTYRYE